MAASWSHRGARIVVLGAGLAAVLWFSLGMHRGVMLSTGIESKAWPWAPFLEGRIPEGQVLSDPVWQFVPWLHMAREELRAGRLPLWNPHQNGGQPLLGNSVSALGSPLVWPVLVLGVGRGWNLSILLRILVALLGTCLWLRNAGRSPGAAALGALMFGLSGAFIAWLEHPHTLVAAWAPWLLLAVDRFLDGATASRLTAVAVLTALVFTGGHPETVLMVGLLAGAVVLWSRPGRGRILQSTGAAVLGVGLTLPLLLPFVEYLAHSAAWQGTGRHPFVLPVRALVRFVAPHAAVGHPIEAAATVSVTGLLLAGLGLWLGRAERDTLFWGVLALAMLLVTYDNPLARLVALHTPIYATRVLLVLPLALGWLAARGLDGLIALPRAAWGRVAVAAILPLVVGGELLLAARGVHAHSPPDEIAMQTPMLRFLQSQKGPFRILPLHTFLPPESATLYGLDDVRGYDALAPAGWLVQRESMGRFTSLSMVTDVLEPWNLAPGGEGLDFWNVEFLLVHPQFDLSVEDWARPLGLDLEVVYDGPDGRVFRNRRALPRVRCEEGSPVRILKRTPLEWTVEVDCRKEDRLVVADPWFPGWRAFLDGREVPWALEAGDPMVCTVPAGRHVVRVLYRPLSFELGLLGAGISLLVLLLWAWWLRGGVTACGRG